MVIIIRLVVCALLLAVPVSAIDFPIYMGSCYTKSSTGAIKNNTDRTPYADIYFEFAASGSPEIYCDVEYPVGAGNSWTFSYDLTAITSVASKNVCITASNVVILSNDNVTSISMNAGTLKSCAADATAHEMFSCTASAETIKTSAAASCTSSCEKHLAKLKFIRDNSGSCTNNHTGAADLRLIHVSTN